MSKYCQSKNINQETVSEAVRDHIKKYWSSQKRDSILRAEEVFNHLIEQMDKSENKLLQRLKNTFERWGEEILNFFKFRLTNARVEGYNNKNGSF